MLRKSIFRNPRRRPARRRLRLEFRIIRLLALSASLSTGQLSAEIRIHPSGVLDGSEDAALQGGSLAAELQCARCHVAPPKVMDFLNTRSAPHLESLARDATPDWVRDFLNDPYQTKPGTGHPDMLHSVKKSERAEKIENLVQFIKSTSGGANEIADDEAVGADPYLMKIGKRLYHQVGCVACHAPQESMSALFPVTETVAETDSFFGLEELEVIETKQETAWESLKTKSIPLGNLAKKTTVSRLTEYLVNPQNNRPWSRMPNLGLSEREAKAIAMYLLREQVPGMSDPTAPLNKIAGVRYEYYEASSQNEFPEILESGEPTKTGIAPSFSIATRERNENIGFRFTGLIRIKDPGTYTFYTASDDGSEFYINGEHLVQNGGMHGRVEKSGSINLTKGDHPFILTWYNGGGGYELDVYYEGPGIAKQTIPSDVLFYMGQKMKPTAPMALEINPDRIQLGAQIYNELQCVNCHGATPITAKVWEYPKAADTPLLELDLESCGSCVDALAGPNKPKYNWTSSQRRAVADFIATANRIMDEPQPTLALEHRMAQLNCYACHQRNGKGGPTEVRREYFQTLGEADLGDEGRIPPLLQGAGAKLKKSWLAQVLNEGTKVRPYMATRMPRFNKDAAFLANHLIEIDQNQPDESIEDSPYDINAGKYGRKLAGAVDGLSCVTCHTFGDYPSLGIPAMSLTWMGQRLNESWFKQYMVDPAKFRPGTRMPSFWPEGKAVNQTILEGNTEQQLDAIWTYLSQGEEADPPPGLIQGQMEIVATDEAVIYRHFIQDAGSRAIGVGYPEKANLAWDANQLRLALIWHGPFIDAAKHRIGRGPGYEGPLGNNIRRFANGPNFAFLEDTESTPWPTNASKNAGYEMRGYMLDKVRRPTFMYSLGNVEFREKFIAVPQTLDASFKRELQIMTKNDSPDKLWFRAATGSRIEAADPGKYRVDETMITTLTLPPGVTPIIRSIDGQQELLIPVAPTEKPMTFTQEIIW